MKKIYLVILIAIGSYSLTGCSSSPSCCVIVPPDINLTGQKTVVERQIIGDYRELEKDAWAVSSVRTAAGKKNISGKMSGDPELFKYMKVREYHTDKIREYKVEGAIGEAGSGYIQYIESKKYESSPAEKKLLMVLIEEENKSRQGIFNRSIFLAKGSEPSKGEVESFGREFAEEQRAIAAKDEWVQGTSGRWERKK